MSKFHEPENIIYVCVGSKCSKRGGKDMCKELKHLIKEAGQKDEMEVIKVECSDRCKYAPVLSVQPANVWFKEYSEKDVHRILRIASGE